MAQHSELFDDIFHFYNLSEAFLRLNLFAMALILQVAASAMAFGAVDSKAMQAFSS
jgi:hypothetical protein